MSAAIVTTLKLPHGETRPLYSFIEYHLSIGFSHIYLYFDDDNNDCIPDVRMTYKENITTLLRSKELDNFQKSCFSYNSLKDILIHEVPARQMLNMEYAAILASNAGFDWLLHIDIDEVHILNHIIYCNNR